MIGSWPSQLEFLTVDRRMLCFKSHAHRRIGHWSNLMERSNLIGYYWSCAVQEPTRPNSQVELGTTRQNELTRVGELDSTLRCPRTARMIFILLELCWHARVMAVMAKHRHVRRVPLPTNPTLLLIAALRGMGYCQCLSANCKSIDSFWFCSAEGFCLYSGAVQIKLTKIGCGAAQAWPRAVQAARWHCDQTWQDFDITSFVAEDSMWARCYAQRAYISQHPKHSFASKILERHLHNILSYGVSKISSSV